MINVAREVGKHIIHPTQIDTLFRLINQEKEYSVTLDFGEVVYFLEKPQMYFLQLMSQSNVKVIKKSLNVECRASLIGLWESKRYLDYTAPQAFWEAEVTTPKPRLTKVIKEVLDKPRSDASNGRFNWMHKINYHKQEAKIMNKEYEKTNLPEKELIEVIQILYKNDYSIKEIEERLHVGEDKIKSVISVV